MIKRLQMAIGMLIASIILIVIGAILSVSIIFILIGIPILLVGIIMLIVSVLSLFSGLIFGTLNEIMSIFRIRKMKNEEPGVKKPRPKKDTNIIDVTEEEGIYQIK
jgi:hypothetical protein